MNSKKADYRKLNDRTGNSSTYHKRDCTNVRAKLKVAAEKEIKLSLLNAELMSLANSLKEELLKMKEKNAELQELVDEFDAGVYQNKI